MGGAAVGLFYKAGHAVRAWQRGQGRPSLNVAIAGFWPRGGNAKGDKMACGGGLGGGGHGAAKGGLIADGVVCGQHQHQCAGVGGGVGRAVGQVQCGQGDGRGGVTARGFQVGSGGGVAYGVQLLSYQEAVIFIGNDDGRRHWLAGAGVQCCRALGGVLQQGVLACERQQLLGVSGARQGPQAGARAAAQDDGVEGVWRCGCHGAALSGWWGVVLIAQQQVFDDLDLRFGFQQLFVHQLLAVGGFLLLCLELLQALLQLLCGFGFLGQIGL